MSARRKSWSRLKILERWTIGLFVCGFGYTIAVAVLRVPFLPDMEFWFYKTQWIATVMDPVFPPLGKFTRDLTAYGYEHQVNFVRHVFGVSAVFINAMVVVSLIYFRAWKMFVIERILEDARRGAKFGLRTKFSAACGVFLMLVYFLHNYTIASAAVGSGRRYSLVHKLDLAAAFDVLIFYSAYFVAIYCVAYMVVFLMLSAKFGTLDLQQALTQRYWKRGRGTDGGNAA